MGRTHLPSIALIAQSGSRVRFSAIRINLTLLLYTKNKKSQHNADKL